MTTRKGALVRQRTEMSQVYRGIDRKELVSRILRHVFHNQLLLNDRSTDDVAQELVRVEANANFDINVQNVGDDAMQPAQTTVNTAYRDALNLACTIRSAMRAVPSDSDQRELVIDFLEWVKDDPMSAEAKRLQAQVDQTRTERDDKAQALQRANDQIDALKRAQEEMADKNRVLRDLVSERNADMKACEDARRGMEAENRDLEERIQDKKRQLQELSQRADAEKDDVLALTEALDEARDALNACQEELDESQSKGADLEKQLGASQADAEEQGRRAKECAEQLEAAAARATDLDQRVADLENELKGAQDTNSARQLENTDLVRKLVDAKDDSDALRRALEQSGQREQDAERETSRLRDAKKACEDLIAAMENQLKQCKRENELMREAQASAGPTEKPMPPLHTSPDTLGELAYEPVPRDAADAVGWSVDRAGQAKDPRAGAIQTTLKKTWSDDGQNWVPVEAWVYAWDATKATSAEDAVQRFYTKGTTPKPAMDSVKEDAPKESIFRKHAAPDGIRRALAVPLGVPLNLSDGAQGANPFMFSNTPTSAPSPLRLRLYSKAGDDGNSSEFDAGSGSFLIKINDEAGVTAGSASAPLAYRVVTLWADSSNRHPVQLTETQDTLALDTTAEADLVPPGRKECPPCPRQPSPKEEITEEEDDLDDEELDELLRGLDESPRDRPDDVVVPTRLSLSVPSQRDMTWDQQGGFLEMPYTAVGTAPDHGSMEVGSVRVTLSRTTDFEPVAPKIGQAIRSRSFTVTKRVTLRLGDKLLLRLYEEGRQPSAANDNTVDVVLDSDSGSLQFPRGPKQSTDGKEREVRWRWWINVDVFGPAAGTSDKPLTSHAVFWDTPEEPFAAAKPVGSSISAFSSSHFNYLAGFFTGARASGDSAVSQRDSYEL